MLFAEPFKIQNILPWVIVALVVIMLGAILGKSISTYRNIKKNRTSGKKDDQPKQQLLAIRGEYFVLSIDCEFLVGEGGQLRQGSYLLRGDGYDKFELTINGETKQFDGDSVVNLSNGDVVTPTTCNVLIKPIVD